MEKYGKLIFISSIGGGDNGMGGSQVFPLLSTQVSLVNKIDKLSAAGGSQ